MVKRTTGANNPLKRRPVRARARTSRRCWRHGDAFLMRQSDVTYESLMRRPARGRLRAIPVSQLFGYAELREAWHR